MIVFRVAPRTGRDGLVLKTCISVLIPAAAENSNGQTNEGKDEISGVFQR